MINKWSKCCLEDCAPVPCSTMPYKRGRRKYICIFLTYVTAPGQQQLEPLHALELAEHTTHSSALPPFPLCSALASVLAKKALRPTVTRLSPGDGGCGALPP